MAENGKVAGSCLCGAFQFEIAVELGEVRFCHCETCRRANGTAYSANAAVPVDNFRLLTDRSTIREYQSSPGAWRAFCSNCGWPAYARAEWDPDNIRVRLGTLDKDASPNITGHVWVRSKADWDEITDDLPQLPAGANDPNEQ